MLGALASLGFAAPGGAQTISGGAVVYGRVEDALTREPVEGARVLSADSSSVGYTDALGIFGIPMPTEGPFAVWAERFGYLSQHFDLGDDALSHVSVLRLEPAPLAIETITVEAQAAVSELIDRLENRRNSFPGPVRSFDRAGLERLAQPGSAYDFLRIRVPRLTFCDHDPFQLCLPGRFRNFGNLNPQVQVSVCVDDWKSFVPSSELQTLPIEAVSLVEIYPGEIRVYTTQWMLSRARRGRTRVLPLIMGCTGL